MNKKKMFTIIFIVLFIFLTSCFFIIKNIKSTAYGKLDNIYGIILRIDDHFNKVSLKDKSVYEIRKITERNCNRWNSKPIKLSNIKTIDIQTNINKIPARIYTPSKGENFPIVIYSHGGSWISGNIDDYENICRKISNDSNSIVISVNYRLAPENPFPAGLNDVYNILLWSYSNASNIKGNPNKIAVVGDSAGGNFSASISQIARDKNGPKITCQVLIYPATNIYELNTKSWIDFGSNFNFNIEKFKQFISLYTPSLNDRKSVYASPLLSTNLKNLPDALVITAEFDPLRDDGENYAKELQNEGVKVTLTRYTGVTHGFVSAGKITKKSNDALNEISKYLVMKFNRS
ncbi:acetyl esterase [Clostridium cavendishii DSM 21758]|uniref:Acetyl esterase n=1 Tax=Clostridium cavendishii DSM 21758 TaxID=1121302 RepID=A0A1M6N834_9CLOT|nr:alpha/beta hydrolase [Clostridium cavendishii]SHJ91822.1 acetyl esterase [Clostridium cavendishii DSM 21758]